MREKYDIILIMSRVVQSLSRIAPGLVVFNQAEQAACIYSSIIFAGSQWAPNRQIVYGIADSPIGLAAWLLDHGDGEVQPSTGLTNKLDKGGHFAAWEQPELFAAEVRAGFKSLR